MQLTSHDVIQLLVYKDKWWNQKPFVIRFVKQLSGGIYFGDPHRSARIDPSKVEEALQLAVIHEIPIHVN